MAGYEGRPGAPRFTVESGVDRAGEYAPERVEAAPGVWVAYPARLLVARCGMRATFPELDGIVWVWGGGPYVDYGLSRGQAVDCLNVWDYAAGVSTVEFTADAFGRFLSEWYDDRAERDGARQVVDEWRRYRIAG